MGGMATAVSGWFRIAAAGLLVATHIALVKGAVPATGTETGRPLVSAPRIERPPMLEDFAGMKPAPWLEGRLAKVGNFVQWVPRDGQPASQRTEAYLAYDPEHLYAILLCFDSEPERIRARLGRRGEIMREDRIDLFLDTFDDQRRAYAFTVNAYGVQADARWIERDTQQYDSSFDTVWQSDGVLTDRGYMVRLAIPFRSLRFKAEPEQRWGIILARWIPRVNEGSFWPHVSTRIEGRLNQSALLTGLKDVSPGRNIQLIPFGFFRSFRALDQRGSRFLRESFEPDAGLDAKLVLKDSFALDVALNPDFNQIESDEPQVTVNQRFEVFFPEKRPFFLENASYFETPMNLVFTRRIADPRFGVRLTGKSGPYALAVLYADDDSVGKAVSPGDPLFGETAHFGIFRVSRDMGEQSAVGGIYTERRIAGAFNRVGGLDARVKMTPNWVATVQGATSSTRLEEGDSVDGAALDVAFQRTGRQLSMSTEYNERGPGFRTLTGFLPGTREALRAGRPRTRRIPLRQGIRSARHFTSYRFRPEGDFLISWGPDINVNPSWSHDGKPLDLLYGTDLSWEITRQTHLGLLYTGFKERLRPEDVPLLPATRSFSSHRHGVFWSSNLSRRFVLQGEYTQGTQINLVPPAGQEPVLADSNQGNLQVTWFPTSFLRAESTYIVLRVVERSSAQSVFNNHIVRTRLNWQFSREMSARVILQYAAVLANPAATSLTTDRSLNTDLLFTYLVNPWTALYVGYNNNLRNLDLLAAEGGDRLLRTPDLRNDSWQFFVKFSYYLGL
jgi:hypothetical protein